MNPTKRSLRFSKDSPFINLSLQARNKLSPGKKTVYRITLIKRKVLVCLSMPSKTAG